MHTIPAAKAVLAADAGTATDDMVEQSPGFRVCRGQEFPGRGLGFAGCTGA